MPQDTLNLLREERGGYVDIDMSESMNWKACASDQAHGMRNSNCLPSLRPDDRQHHRGSLDRADLSEPVEVGNLSASSPSSTNILSPI